MNISNFSKICLLLLIITLALAPNMSYAEESKAVIYFFWGEGCPYCEHQKPFLEDLQNNYDGVEVRSYEVWRDRENYPLLLDMAKAYGIRATGVPATFFHDRSWIGFSANVAREIENTLISCIDEGCINPMDKIDKKETPQPIEDTTPQPDEICIHLFIHGECPQCGEILPYVDQLRNEYEIEIVIHDVVFEEEQELYELFKESYGLSHGAYPIMFIGNKILIGNENIRNNLHKEIDTCLGEGCACPTEKIRNILQSMPKFSEHTSEGLGVINVPFIGAFDLSNMSLGLMTFLIAFVDGFNPCSLWVLTFLLGIVIYTGSKKKVFIVGITYLLVTSAVYGLFIIGMLNVFTYIGFVGWIRLIVSLFALTFAAVNIKDFFWYKKGLSFTIPDKYKPKIFKKIRGVMDPKKSIYSMILATIVMALGITLVELPCTAGFPVLWTGILTSQGIKMLSLTFAILLAIYLLVYLSVELIIFFGTVMTLKKTKFEEKHGRLLKLVGGSIMLALGLTFAFKPEYMESMSATFGMFSIAIVGSVIVGVLYDKFIGFNGKNKTKESKNEVKKDE